ncbi:MAG: DnaJ domain-containing protein [Pyrinomonadaceae bacterium]|nr:DnaJ domain-containing protein [Phycisphaerales bacterium]
MLTHYDILGVTTEATREEIRRAYRAAARLIHPDANPAHDATKKFAALSQAYEVLSDAKRRREYDEKLRSHSNLAADADGAPSGQAHYTWTNIATDASPKAGSASIGQHDFDEMYNAYFGKGKKSRPRPG